MIRYLRCMALASLLLAVAMLPAPAQTPSVVNPPYNVDLGVQITNTVRTAGTVTTSQLDNLAYKGVVCTFVQTAASGSPSTTFSIQGYDAATASYLTYVTSSAITDTTVTAAAVYPGLLATAVPSGVTAINMHLPRKWRISQTIGGSSGPATTSKIGCVGLN